MDLKLIAKRAYNANALRGIYTPFYTKMDTILKADEERAEFLEEVDINNPHSMNEREEDEMMDEILLRLAEYPRCGSDIQKVYNRVIKHNETRED